MKSKFLSLLIGGLLCFMSLPVSTAEADDSMWMTPVTSEEAASLYEFLQLEGSCHDTFTTLVDAMMKVKAQGIYTKEDIKAVHKFYEAQVASNAKIPTDTKGLLDLLYSNNIITKTQYDQTLIALQ